MRTIKINASKSYDVIIDKNIILAMKDNLNNYIKSIIKIELHKIELKNERERERIASEQHKANKIAKVREGYSKDF